MSTLTHAQISVANSKVFCKLGNGTVRDLTLDTNTIYTHPAAIQCNAATEINSLKSSVSNGKTLIANAITGKGVATSSSATFATMANNIGSIQSRSAFDKKLGEVFGNTAYAQSYSFRPDSYTFLNGNKICIDRAGKYYVSAFDTADFSGRGSTGSLEKFGSNAQGVRLAFGVQCYTATALWEIFDPYFEAYFWGPSGDVKNLIRFSQNRIEQSSSKLHIQLTCKITNMSTGNAGTNSSFWFTNSANVLIDTLTIDLVWNSPNFDVQYAGNHFNFYM